MLSMVLRTAKRWELTADEAEALQRGRFACLTFGFPEAMFKSSKEPTFYSTRPPRPQTQSDSLLLRLPENKRSL